MCVYIYIAEHCRGKHMVIWYRRTVSFVVIFFSPLKRIQYGINFHLMAFFINNGIVELVVFDTLDCQEERRLFTLLVIARTDLSPGYFAILKFSNWTNICWAHFRTGTANAEQYISWRWLCFKPNVHLNIGYEIRDWNLSKRLVEVGKSFW